MAHYRLESRNADQLTIQSAEMLPGQVFLRQVPLDYPRHVPGSDAGIPDVVGVDEDDGALVVTAGADVAQHGGGREPAPLDLGPESLDELSAAFRAAASLAWRGAHENLSQLCHGTNSMPHKRLF